MISTKKVNPFVISIGNITLGGVGKTKLVEFLTKTLTRANNKVVILTRGYGRKTNEILALNDTHTNYSVEQVGDEAFFLFQNLNTPVIIGKKRVLTAKIAINKFTPDYIILDDAYQYLKLKKSLEILVIDATKPFGNNKIFPAGILRESVRAIKRADILLINRYDEVEEEKLKLLKNYISRIKKLPIIESRYVPKELKDINNNSHNLALINNKDIIAFCAIGNPNSFYNTLSRLNANIVKFYTFVDHYFYQEKDLENLMKVAEENNIEFIITTEKDLVKVQTAKCKMKNVFSLVVDIKIKEVDKFMNYLMPQ